MAILKMYNLDGQELENVEVSADVFGITPNKQVWFDAVVAQQASLRQGTHKVKNRSEVRGGGRKPWKQKGTGRARAGSTRSPIWAGGGVVFGPTPRSYGFRLNRKVRKLALTSALSQKVKDSELLVVENLAIDAVKTKDFVKVMENLKLERKILFVVANDEDAKNANLSMRNIPGTHFLNVEGLNVYDIVNSNRIVFTEKAAIAAGEVFA